MDDTTNGIMDDYFGLCPECARNDGYRMIGEESWFVCDTHKLKWLDGIGIFSNPCADSPDEYRRNNEHWWAVLSEYREVEPFFYPDAELRNKALERN